MAVFNEPSKWQTSLVNSGDANTIPQSTPAGTGEASFEDGFPQITQVPIGAGGIAPDRKDFNGLFKVLGDWIFFAQNGGLPTYSADFDYVVGRYVVYNNTLYKCIQANGASSTVVAPDSVSPLGSDYWKDIENQDSTSLIPNQTIVSELPLTDANLHLKDGALLSGSGAYSDYVDLIAEIYNSGDATTSFCTEAEWQTSNTNYGFCNKFVYDSVANTVRLPKINSEHGALIKSYSSGSDWYRIYQDGWCEQGGVGLSGVNNPISYHIAYINKPFVQMSPLNNFASYLNANLGNAISTSTSSFIITLNSADDGYKISSSKDNIQCAWFACGYIDISGLQTALIYEYIVVGTVSKTQIQIDIDNVMSDLALKADKDFSNVTAPVQAFKDMSVEWGVPDFSAKVTQSFNTNYTASSNGFILIYVRGINGVTGTATINGVSQEFVYNGDPTHATSSSLLIPISKSSSYTIAISGGTLSSQSYMSFIPCLGAN